MISHQASPHQEVPILLIRSPSGCGVQPKPRARHTLTSSNNLDTHVTQVTGLCAFVLSPAIKRMRLQTMRAPKRNERQALATLSATKNPRKLALDKSVRMHMPNICEVTSGCNSSMMRVCRDNTHRNSRMLGHIQQCGGDHMREGAADIKSVACEMCKVWHFVPVSAVDILGSVHQAAQAHPLRTEVFLWGRPTHSAFPILAGLDVDNRLQLWRDCRPCVCGDGPTNGVGLSVVMM